MLAIMLQDYFSSPAPFLSPPDPPIQVPHSPHSVPPFGASHSVPGLRFCFIQQQITWAGDRILLPMSWLNKLFFRLLTSGFRPLFQLGLLYCLIIRGIPFLWFLL